MSEIDKLKSQHPKQLEKIASNCKKFLVTKELNVAETEKDGVFKQWFEERSRREQIELELRIATGFSQFEELASQITGSVSSIPKGFNPVNWLITKHYRFLPFIFFISRLRCMKNLIYISCDKL